MARTIPDTDRQRKARAEMIRERFGVDPAVVLDDWQLSDDRAGITFTATIQARVSPEWASRFIAGGPNTRLAYPCTHWSPGRITYRDGCTACATEGVPKVEIDA